MKTVFWGLLLLTLLGRASGETVAAPSFSVGDTWVYHETTERGPTGFSEAHTEISVVRATRSAVYFTSHNLGPNQPSREQVAGVDWSRLRTIEGKEVTVNRPLAFPLSSDSHWEVRYSEPHPNKQHRLESFATQYSVSGTETVDVGAGRFEAIKIEAEGTWTAELEPAQVVVQGVQNTQGETQMFTDSKRVTTQTTSGRLYKAFWYVPAIKRWVKSVEEYYSSNGVRTERYLSELESVTLAKDNPPLQAVH
jgi:hypothetical protein